MSEDPIHGTADMPVGIPEWCAWAIAEIERMRALADGPGITVTLVHSPVYNGTHIRKWENHGLSEGTYRLVVVEDGKG